MFGLGLLFYVIVLLLNSVAILSEDRFIMRIGLSKTPAYGNDDSISSRVLSLIRSVRTVMRPFLIAFNIFIIAYELVWG
ncbi:similar to Saccharomyces cerevisiae YER074W-A YOS1 Integral membrane protein required for ER to Golgi transport [Geotrichum candidum]|uniref:Similar to Saccharomyces cerevisiae YER074W-A YOS1 Integral membrane protein required for ER to Golgi transport n=1 Tax=Geotrichum candidum TaxID=1173061 RepID=A0A0J9X451_GEOCN|nr:similar to Saccharomyces cerevisiae YER074W-A YOS1 Integral membrane protein required for ER to Golgi transport [Geotrichum candidum]